MIFRQPRAWLFKCGPVTCCQITELGLVRASATAPTGPEALELALFAFDLWAQTKDPHDRPREN